MLLEDIWQEPPIFVSAFAADPEHGPILMQNIGKFNGIGNALAAARKYSVDQLNSPNAKQFRTTRPKSNGITTRYEEGPDVRQVKTAQFERIGKFWVAVMGKIRIIASQAGFPPQDVAQELVTEYIKIHAEIVE